MQVQCSMWHCAHVYLCVCECVCARVWRERERERGERDEKYYAEGVRLGNKDMLTLFHWQSSRTSTISDIRARRGFESLTTRLSNESRSMRMKHEEREIYANEA